MKDIINAGYPFSNDQKLLLEFWLEPSLSKLIYRMIILNAGQKAMSMRHQVELLFLSLKDTIEGEVEGIQLLTEKESTRRTSSKMFNLGHIASAYYAYITSSSEIDKENLVAQHLSNNEILDSSESELNEKFESFITHLRLYVELDELAWNHYTRILPIYEQKFDTENDESKRKELKRKITVIRESLSWFSSENVMLSFFSAVAVFRNTEERKNRVIISLNSLKEELKLDDKEDILGMLILDKIKEGLNPKLHNIGFATRKQISNTFKEFFREKGEVVFCDCWSLATE
jgi:lysyl-tRNA synthetase class I